VRTQFGEGGRVNGHDDPSPTPDRNIEPFDDPFSLKLGFLLRRSPGRHVDHIVPPPRESRNTPALIILFINQPPLYPQVRNRVSEVVMPIAADDCDPIKDQIIPIKKTDSESSAGRLPEFLNNPVKIIFPSAFLPNPEIVVPKADCNGNVADNFPDPGKHDIRILRMADISANDDRIDVLMFDQGLYLLGVIGHAACRPVQIGKE